MTYTLDLEKQLKKRNVYKNDGNYVLDERISNLKETWFLFGVPNNLINFNAVRCCKPSDLTYTLDLEKQLKKRNDFKNLFD